MLNQPYMVVSREKKTESITYVQLGEADEMVDQNAENTFQSWSSKLRQDSFMNQRIFLAGFQLVVAC